MSTGQRKTQPQLQITQQKHKSHTHNTNMRRGTDDAHTRLGSGRKTQPHPHVLTRMGYPTPRDFFGIRERGTPRHEGGIASGDGVPHPTRFFWIREWGTPSGREIPKCVFFLFVNRNAVSVSHVWFYRARGRHFGSSFTSFRSSAMPGTQHCISALYTNAETGPGMPRNPGHVPHRACPHLSL